MCSSTIEPEVNIVWTSFAHHIDSAMGSRFTSSAVGRGFETRSDQTIRICCFSANQAELAKNWLSQNQKNVERHVYSRTVVLMSNY